MLQCQSMSIIIGDSLGASVNLTDLQTDRSFHVKMMTEKNTVCEKVKHNRSKKTIDLLINLFAAVFFIFQSMIVI